MSVTGRRKTVTAAELKEFETQVECAGWSKPQVLSTDHGKKKERNVFNLYTLCFHISAVSSAVPYVCI